MRNKAPYRHSSYSINTRPLEWLAAVAPVFVWGTYLYGGRVIVLGLLGALFSMLLDYPLRRYLFKLERGARIDLMTAIYGTLATFAMPATAPLWFPALTSVLVVFAKNMRVRNIPLFNPFIFSAAFTSLLFKPIMTAFTRPFAYFSPFQISLDPVLVNKYAVISPLQYTADGSVYEDGIISQFYGYASGNWGEIAVAAMAVGFLWMLFRKEMNWRGTVTYLMVILLLGLFFPSSDAENNYFAYSVLLSGGIFYMGFYAMNEKSTVPSSTTGLIIFAAVSAILTFVLRKVAGGFEWGYFVILLMNLLTPLLDKYTRPMAVGEKALKKRRAKIKNVPLNQLEQGE